MNIIRQWWIPLILSCHALAFHVGRHYVPWIASGRWIGHQHQTLPNGPLAYPGHEQDEVEDSLSCHVRDFEGLLSFSSNQYHAGLKRIGYRLLWKEGHRRSYIYWEKEANLPSWDVKIRQDRDVDIFANALCYKHSNKIIILRDMYNVYIIRQRAFWLTGIQIKFCE